MKSLDNLPERFIVVDFQNTLWKSWLAARPGEVDLTRSTDGYPTGHIFRFFRTLHKWKRDFSGDLIICYEGGERRRYEIFPEYKAGRKRDHAFNPIPDAKSLVRLISCTELQPDRAEADDAIAAFVHKYPNARHLILSSDKDLWGLRAKNVNIVSFQNILTDADIRKSCEKHFGTPNPKCITLAKALFGDKSDGLPGVPRLLKKHVAKLVEEVSTPDEFYADLSKVPAKTANKLRDFEEQVRKMYEVVQLRTDVRMRRRDNPGNREALQRFLEEFECHSLLPQVRLMT